jgi:DNA processing protein
MNDPEQHTDKDEVTAESHGGELGDEERAARAAWSRLAEPTDAAAYELVATRGAASALAEVRAGKGKARWQARLPHLDLAADRVTLERFGARLLIPGDDEWPPGLSVLGERAPFCLWVRGPLRLARATTGSVAIIGARASTAYGERVARELGEGCAHRGITVVAGAAYGVDGAAHRGALAAGGPTIAVLACGIDVVYPRGHEQLIDQIARQGAVVSEIPPGFGPTRSRFMERARLIAAMSSATVVVEAASRSGALVTAAAASALGRAVGAVPGPVTSVTSSGCHQLFRTGATCVTSADDVAELIEPRTGSAQQPR